MTPDSEANPIGEMTVELLLTSLAENKRDRALFNLFIATGLKLFEAHQLNHDSIKLREDPLTGRWTGQGSVEGKGGKRRKFSVDHVTVVFLIEYLETRTDRDPALFISERKTRFSKCAIQDTWMKLCRRLNAPMSHIHQLRHTFATRMVNHDLPVIKLKELMGHRSLTTTMGYYKLDEVKLAASYDAAMEWTC